MAPAGAGEVLSQDRARRVLVATDGAPGLIRAVEECFPTSLRQRCLAHRMRTILAKLPEEAIDEFRQAATAAYQAPSPATARALKGDLVERFGKGYPAAVACFEEDFCSGRSADASAPARCLVVGGSR